MEILAENIDKNFNDVPTFLRFMRVSKRVLTLVNTQMVIDRAQTYKSREEKLPKFTLLQRLPLQRLRIPRLRF